MLIYGVSGMFGYALWLFGLVGRGAGEVGVLGWLDMDNIFKSRLGACPLSHLYS